MKIKNLEIKKTLKETTVALLTGAMILTTPIAETKTVEASTITQNNYDVMYYFAGTIQDDVENYLEKSKSSTNLNKLLGYYDILYDFINNGKYVKNKCYRNLEYYEQDSLNNLLVYWGNEIYDLYKNQSYFKSSCKNKLGFYLTYKSNEIRYYPQNPTVSTTPGVIPPSVSTIKPAPVVPSMPQVNNGQAAVGLKINNTIGKDWSVHFSNPYPNTSNGVRDFVPQNIYDLRDEENYFSYPQQYISNGYLDSYGNFIPYNNGNDYGYTPDYTPSKVLK